MAERQTRVIVQSLHLSVVKNSFLLALLMGVTTSIFTHQSHAKQDVVVILAAADTASATADANQVKWAQLSKSQQDVLAPLASEWDSLRPWQREQMLDIARDYPKMDAQKQARIQKHLAAWSRMTPFERENARKRYQQFQNLSPEKKAELRKKWAEHQKLPEVEREKLRKESSDVYYDPDLE
jgi:hypothetical protein